MPRRCARCSRTTRRLKALLQLSVLFSLASTLWLHWAMTPHMGGRAGEDQSEALNAELAWFGAKLGTTRAAHSAYLKRIDALARSTLFLVAAPSDAHVRAVLQGWARHLPRPWLRFVGVCSQCDYHAENDDAVLLEAPTRFPAAELFVRVAENAYVVPENVLDFVVRSSNDAAAHAWVAPPLIPAMATRRFLSECVHVSLRACLAAKGARRLPRVHNTSWPSLVAALDIDGAFPLAFAHNFSSNAALHGALDALFRGTLLY